MTRVPRKYRLENQTWMEECQMPKCKRTLVICSNILEDGQICGHKGHWVRWAKQPVIFNGDNCALVKRTVQHGHYTKDWDGKGRNVNCTIDAVPVEKMYWQHQWQLIGNKNMPKWLRDKLGGD